MNYGIIPTLFLLKKYEEEDQFENCIKIRDIITNNNKELKLDLPTSLEGIDVEQFIVEGFSKFGIIPKNYWNNLDYYIEEVEKEIIKMKTV